MRKQLVALMIDLRSQQNDYLDYLAEKAAARALAGGEGDDEPNRSEALRQVLDRMMEAHPKPDKRMARKERRNFVLTTVHVAFVDGLAARAGISRSEMLRRLIDLAAANDPAVKVIDAPPHAA